MKWIGSNQNTVLSREEVIRVDRFNHLSDRVSPGSPTQDEVFFHAYGRLDWHSAMGNICEISNTSDY